MAEQNIVKTLAIGNVQFRAPYCWEELGVTEDYLKVLLSRDEFAPILSAKPTSATTSYTDPATGIATAFHEGQCAIYPDSNLPDGYGLCIAKKITYNASNVPTSVIWLDTSISKANVEGLLTGTISTHTHTFASLASKPTTVSGYGITDAVTANAAQTISGAKTFSAALTAASFKKTGGTSAQILMADGSVATKVSRTSVGTLGWLYDTGANEIPTLSRIAYWDGRYNADSATASNLTYCYLGKFGTMAIANAADYVTLNTAQTINGAKTFSSAIKTTATQGFLSETATGIWSYMRLKSNTAMWDIAVKDTDTSGALQFRVNGSESNRVYITPAGEIKAPKFTKIGGTSSQFLKADGSVDTNAYALASHAHTFASLTSKPTTLSGYGITDAITAATASSTYVKKAGDTITGQLTIQNNVYNQTLILKNTPTKVHEGVGIKFCSTNDDPQSVILRHEYFDDFVTGMGLAISRQDKLAEGDALVFFYNTGRYISKAPQGTKPIAVDSTTLCNNLNADLLDGYHASSFATAASLANYVKKSGDTMTGVLYLGSTSAQVFANTTYGAWLQYGSDYINIHNGELWKNNVNRYWHAGNDGSGSGLDADLLDGVHNGDVTAKYFNYTKSGIWDCNNPTNTVHSNYGSAESDIKNVPTGWRFGQLFTIGRYGDLNDNLAAQFIWDAAHGTKNPGTLWFRVRDAVNHWSKNWGQLAFTTDNVASATKLQTARTLWGQSFNGTANVSGALSGVTDITMSGNINIGVNKITSGSDNMSLLQAANAQRLLTGGLLTSDSYADKSKIPTGGIYSKGNIITAGSLSANTLNVAQNTLVSNLNADMVDGVHNGSLTANKINANSLPAGGSGLSWFSGQVTVGTAAGNAVAGSSATQNLWSFPDGGTAITNNKANIMDLHLSWDSTNYWVDIFTSPNYEGLWYRLVANKAAQPWRKIAFISDNVASATKLHTARTINGTFFDGTTNITTANWGTARNISISDSAGTNTGTAVSVNGSAATTLKLPATIAAAISGNASSATKLQTARTIWGQSFNGTANVSGALTGVTNITASGTIHATTGIYSDNYVSAKGQNTSSDARLKDVTSDFTLDLNQIANAPSVNFSWKDSHKADVGSIAQYWRGISPYLTPDMPDGSMGLQYGKTALLSVITVAKKTINLQEKVKQLEEKVVILQTRIKELETK